MSRLPRRIMIRRAQPIMIGWDPEYRMQMAERSVAAPRFSIGRFSENELVLFDEQKQESWIIYPPRSAYDFLPTRRQSKSVTLVEHHPWAPFTRSRDHQLRAEKACLVHGLTCPANEAVEAAVQLGFDPFA